MPVVIRDQKSYLWEWWLPKSSRNSNGRGHNSDCQNSDGDITFSILGDGQNNDSCKTRTKLHLSSLVSGRRSSVTDSLHLFARWLLENGNGNSQNKNGWDAYLLLVFFRLVCGLVLLYSLFLWAGVPVL